jgi:hypothetical protein
LDLFSSFRAPNSNPNRLEDLEEVVEMVVLALVDQIFQVLALVDQMVQILALVDQMVQVLAEVVEVVEVALVDQDHLHTSLLELLALTF